MFKFVGNLAIFALSVVLGVSLFMFIDAYQLQTFFVVCLCIFGIVRAYQVHWLLGFVAVIIWPLALVIAVLALFKGAMDALLEAFGLSTQRPKGVL